MQLTSYEIRFYGYSMPTIKIVEVNTGVSLSKRNIVVRRFKTGTVSLVSILTASSVCYVCNIAKNIPSMYMPGTMYTRTERKY